MAPRLLFLALLIWMVSPMSAEDKYTKMRVKQLRDVLASRGVSCKGCIEKQEFVARAVETEGAAPAPAGPEGDFCAETVCL